MDPNTEMPKTDDEFMQRMLNAFPEATVGQDNDGQLVIYTNLRLTGYRIESMGDWIRRWHQG